jgi:AcrR family transcriptional regulator
LREAALALFLDRGFEQTMVTDIAERSGVTARTFFRHFADKREVLFSGSSDLLETSLAALDAAPATLSELDAVAVALDAAAGMIGRDRDFARKRQTVIMANTELRERELIKLASMSDALADGLRRRGVGDPEAKLVAEAGIAVYRVAYEQWVNATEDGDLRDVIRESLARLRSLTAASLAET